MSPTARVGVFMFIALVIVGIFIIKIEEIPIGAKGGRVRIQAVFPSVAGLDEKSPVRVAGVRVGLVESIELQGAHALVTLAIEPGVVLHRGARAEVASLGMLGDKYIELYPGDLTGPLLPPGTVLDGNSPTSFDQVLGSVDAIAADIKAVTASLRQSLGGDAGQQRLDEIIENIRQLSADIRAMVADNRADVDGTIDNFKAFSQTLRDELPRIADKLNNLANRVDEVVTENRGNLSDSMANIKELSEKLKVAADNINVISGKIARGEGTIGKLVNDEETVDNLNSTLKSVESGVESLKNTIGRFERFRLDVNMRSEALPGLDDDHSTRTAVGIDLHTTPTRFFRLELVDSPWGRTRKVTENVTTIYGDGRREVTTIERQKTTDTSTVNAQVGFDLSIATVRAGLFESKGGVGVDKALLNKRLKLTLEAYDWGRTTKPPHVRFEGRYFVTRNLFAYAGWDDPRWSQRSSILLGGGLTWQDDDLKYLLGTASAFSGN
jgi:phospholipid/cholesterol/gamma-HCH transport system substrate-binding protein